MVLSGFKVLVLGKDELSVGRVDDFVSSLESPRLVLLFSSLRDDFFCVSFFEECVRGLGVPFIGTRVFGSFVRDGFVDDGVVVVVFSGDFSVGVFDVRLDFNDLGGVVSSMVPQVEGQDLCVVYSSILARELVYLNTVLEGLSVANPSLQFCGGNSSPSPIVATNKGLFEGHIAYAVFEGLDFDFWWGTGFEFERDSKEYVVSSTDGLYVKELNGKDAVEEFTKIQHLQPYFLNMLSSLVSKMEANKLLETLSNASEVLYRGVIKFCIRGLGWDDGGVIEPFGVLHIDDKGLLTVSKVFEGAVVKRINTSKEMQLALYDELKSRMRKPNALLINSCIFRFMYLEYDKERIHERLKTLGCDFVENYMHGEIGNYTPNSPEKSLTHGATTNALILK